MSRAQTIANPQCGYAVTSCKLLTVWTINIQDSVLFCYIVLTQIWKQSPQRFTKGCFIVAAHQFILWPNGQSRLMLIHFHIISHNKVTTIAIQIIHNSCNIKLSCMSIQFTSSSINVNLPLLHLPTTTNILHVLSKAMLVKPASLISPHSVCFTLFDNTMTQCAVICSQSRIVICSNGEFVLS